MSVNPNTKKWGCIVTVFDGHTHTDTLHDLPVKDGEWLEVSWPNGTVQKAKARVLKSIYGNRPRAKAVIDIPINGCPVVRIPADTVRLHLRRTRSKD